MRVQNIRSLGFGKKPDVNESEKNPSMIVSTVLGASVGAIGGSVARNYMPVSDEFFHRTATSDLEDKVKVESAVNSFIENYAASDIESTRVLKTALIIDKDSPLKGHGISALLQDSSVKPVDESDSDELSRSVKALKAQFEEEIKEAKAKNLLSQKIESIDEMAAEKLSCTRKAFFVKENLLDLKDKIKGLSEEGKENIQSIKEHIKDLHSGTPQMREELSTAFSEMVKVAKKAQRPVEAWVVLPAVVAGLCGMGWAVKKQSPQRIEV